MVLLWNKSVLRLVLFFLWVLCFWLGNVFGGKQKLGQRAAWALIPNDVSSTLKTKQDESMYFCFCETKERNG